MNCYRPRQGAGMLEVNGHFRFIANANHPACKTGCCWIVGRLWHSKKKTLF